MTPELKSRIRTTVQQARALLMQETREQLQSLYGLQPDGHFEPLENLPGIVNDPHRRETRRRLELWVEEEQKSGLKGPEAVEKLIKETAFTWLNRLVAFKMMEALKIIRAPIHKGTGSNGFKFYLAEHEEDLQLYESGQVEEAYRRFLLWQCRQIAERDRLEVLFDPDDLPSWLFPRPRALQQLLEWLNDEAISGAWQQEETIGWVYQYFNEQDLQAAYLILKQKSKFGLEHISSVTQLFTPKWIVRFLVHNTLGRLWLQMHPDSRLRKQLNYFVPPAGSLSSRPFKPVREITLMDPACGTMHFGLVAFDLFYEMYREEMERAGDPGWPPQPSVNQEEDIPAAILENNLYGIDIDLRAVQLAALALYLKAKAYNHRAEIRQTNLAVAGVHPWDGQRLQNFLTRFDQDRPLLERVLTALWQRLEDAAWLGTLLRVEQTLRYLIEKERRKFLPLLVGLDGEYEREAADEEYWAILEAKVLQSLDEFVRQTSAHDPFQTFFAGETVRGLRLAHLLLNHYDVVVTNPPYMSRRNMSRKLADLVAEEYPEGKGDLYAAFIIRCLELVNDHGYVGMLTMQSFMFISSYEKLRNILTEEAVVESMVHLGPALFETGNPGTLQTTAFVLRREPNPSAREAHQGVYFRLVHEPDSESKRSAFEQALAAWQKQKEG